MKQCLILAGGDFKKEFAASYIKSKYKNGKPDLLIAADRGIQAVQQLQLCPDIIVGDYDSVDSACLKVFQENPRIIDKQYPPEKNYTDSHLAVSLALEQGVSEICMMGMTGSRLDHVLANVGLLRACVDAGVQAELVDATNRIRMVRQYLEIRREEQLGTYVSLLPYSDCVTGVTLTGFRYPLTDAEFRKEMYENINHDMGPSRGISNEITASRGCIRIKDGYLLVIESRDTET
jgi:thiamine pyrophosphokinase